MWTKASMSDERRTQRAKVPRHFPPGSMLVKVWNDSEC
jgi:hypothetical protein